MARRNDRSVSRGGRFAAEAEAEADLDSDAALAAAWGERLRRLALGATAALIVSRAFWPGEPDYRIDAGGGLAWDLAMLVVAGLALAAALVGGTLRVRWSWTDLALVAAFAFVAASSMHAIDRRPAINLAWEWVALGVAYLLVRWLPRTDEESVALAGALAATAVAVAFYGLFQVGVELPEVQRKYRANPEQALAVVGIQPGTPQQALFESRLLGSNEPYSTFALANSLAGFLVGPLVVIAGIGWNRLTRRDGQPARVGWLALALLPTLAVLICLILTKSRSATVGFLAGLTWLAWSERRRVPPRVLLGAGLGVAALLGALIAAGLATGRLDRQVFTESARSLNFRREYWTGTWRALQANSGPFWAGFGPGNFAAPYVRYKLPEASEDIHDPHNVLLEVWTSGGLRAVLPLLAAIALAFWNLFGPARKPDDAHDERAKAPLLRDPTAEGSKGRRRAARDPSAPPESALWLLVSAGIGGWLLAWPLGSLNPFVGELFTRWMILAGAWLVAVLCGRAVWDRGSLTATALGAGALAILVNLIGAGGISVPAVALMLWSLVALGLNLRVDRPSSRLREAGGRLGAFGMAAVWSAVLGTFVGAVMPHWRLEAEMARADEALDARPPDFDGALVHLNRASEADRFSARPWSRMAEVDYGSWLARGGKPDDRRWKKVPIDLYKAVAAPRAPNSWSRHRERARFSTLLIKQLGDNIPPLEVTKYRADIVQASRKAVELYPTNAALRAWLAEASAEIGMIPDALAEGREALRLDALTPHLDRKLDPAVRTWLQGKLPTWEKQAAESPLPTEPKGKG